jgi:hypothetical protein
MARLLVGDEVRFRDPRRVTITWEVMKRVIRNAAVAAPAAAS